jgi:hypothetical protein
VRCSDFNLVAERVTRLALILCLFAASATQGVALTPPVITATAKGPNQINLTWPATTSAGYGYLVEIMSAGDTRYSSWQELRPIPAASGYTCNNTVIIKGAACNISDPAGTQIYNPPTNGIPYWVAEANYTDPQDDSPAQFIAAGLMPNVAYSFRVRSYSGNTATSYSSYSNTTTATTANYARRYVSPTGSDSNTGVDDAHAWLTLFHASTTLACGQVLIVKGGSYANDYVSLSQKCSVTNKAVVLVNPGETATVTSGPPGIEHVVQMHGNNVVVDGLRCASSSTQGGNADIYIVGGHNAVFNVETRPAVVPTAKAGVSIIGGHNLLYGSYLHDAFSPDGTQNPGGNGGFVLVIQGLGATDNVIWSNHLTRGGHDVSLCSAGCSYNRWQNNIMDGGWGMGFEVIGSNAQFNLFEGNFIYGIGRLVSFYKPSIEISGPNTTVRRNVIVNGKSVNLEVSSLNSGNVVNSQIYNNVFYGGDACYFQSYDGGVASYNGVLYSNNICYKFTGNATDIYRGNTASEVAYNTFLGVNQKHYHLEPLRGRYF